MPNSLKATDMIAKVENVRTHVLKWFSVMLWQEQKVCYLPVGNTIQEMLGIPIAQFSHQHSNLRLVHSQGWCANS